MAEENQTGADGQQEPEQHSPAPKDVNNAKLRTFTQEEVDRIINERLGRERGRKSDYEELKEKAGQTADLESKLSKALEENEKLGEYAEKLMKVFADMRSRGTVADQSARTGQAKAKHSSREDFVNAMSNTLL